MVVIPPNELKVGLKPYDFGLPTRLQPDYIQAEFRKLLKPLENPPTVVWGDSLIHHSAKRMEIVQFDSLRYTVHGIWLCDCVKENLNQLKPKEPYGGYCPVCGQVQSTSINATLYEVLTHSSIYKRK